MFGFATRCSSGPFAGSCSVTFLTFNSSRSDRRSARRPARSASPPAHLHLRQRLPHLDLARRSAPPSPATPAASRASMSADSCSSIRASSAFGKSHRCTLCRLAGRLEVLIHRLGQERHDRREQLRQRHQHGVERLIRGLLVGALLALPEAAAVAADVPVAQLVIDEPLRLQAEGHQVVVLERCPRACDQLLQVRQDPAVEVGPLVRPAPAARSGRSRRSRA